MRIICLVFCSLSPVWIAKNVCIYLDIFILNVSRFNGKSLNAHCERIFRRGYER